VTIFWIAASELRRISAGTLPKLSILALAIIPTLYAGLYLFANENPYGALDQVPAALVVEDRGATSTDEATGKSADVHYGEQVAQRLLESGGFDWIETTDADAQAGVRTGRFDAALVIGPSFSADLVSTERYEPQQASLVLVTNDANNYLVSTIAEQVADQVRDTLSEQVGSQAAATFLTGLATIRTDLSRGVSGTEELVNGVDKLAAGTDKLVKGSARLSKGAKEAAKGSSELAAGARKLARGSERVSNGSATLSNGLDTLRNRTSDLPAQTRRLANGAREVAAGNAEVAAVGRDAAATARQVVGVVGSAHDRVEAALAALVAQGDLTRQEAAEITAVLRRAEGAVDTTADKVEGASSRLNRLSRGSSEVAAGAGTLAGASPELARGIARAASGGDRLTAGARELASGSGTLAKDTRKLASGSSEVADGAQRLATGTVTLRNGTQELQKGTEKLADALREGVKKIPDLNERTRKDMAQNIGDPVRVTDDQLARAGSYGAGLAPFFMSLATWIGAYVLFLLVRPLSARALASDAAGWRVALGGWVTPALIGVAQVAIMFTVVRFALDIRPADEVGTAVLLLLASAAFVMVIQALNAWLGTVGQFLGLVLMLTQLVTAGGTFPWQTIPEPLRSLHRILPMSYSVEGLRQTLYGGDALTVTRAISVLLLTLLAALVATTWAANRQRVWTPARLQPELVL